MTTSPRQQRRRRNPGHILREIVLWGGAAVGVISMLFAISAVAFGVKPLIFMSGSMNPAIPTGSLALVVRTSIDDVRLHDVVSYTTAEGIRITHRVIRIQTISGRPVLTMKGDANKTPDVEPVTQSIVDREFFAVPGLGYVINTMLQPQYSFGGGALVGLVVALGLLTRQVVATRTGSPETETEADEPVQGAVLAPTERTAGAERPRAIALPEPAPFIPEGFLSFEDLELDEMVQRSTPRHAAEPIERRPMGERRMALENDSRLSSAIADAFALDEEFFRMTNAWIADEPELVLSTGAIALPGDDAERE